MLMALENLTDRELETINVTNKRERLKNANKILKKIELINETCAMKNDLG